MIDLGIRYAEWEHVLEQSLQRELNIFDPYSPASIELFDTLDSMPLMELCEIVAIFYYGSDKKISDFQTARFQAAQIGFSGVQLLHDREDLYTFLNHGMERLKQVGPVRWCVEGGAIAIYRSVQSKPLSFDEFLGRAPSNS